MIKVFKEHNVINVLQLPETVLGVQQVIDVIVCLLAQLKKCHNFYLDSFYVVNQCI